MEIINCSMHPNLTSGTRNRGGMAMGFTLVRCHCSWLSTKELSLGNGGSGEQKKQKLGSE